MPRATDIGTRVELVPMDGHFHDIAVALYRQVDDGGRPVFAVHTYSGREGAGDRVAQIASAMAALGGLEASGDGRSVRFPCGGDHRLAVRRVFLEACKLDPALPVQARGLAVVDRKSGLTIAARSLGDGQYRIEAEGDGAGAEQAGRVAVIVNGMLKLGEMRRVEGAEDCVGFDCGCSHDELVGLLLTRAPNVRAIAREQEAMAARGVLAAPSQQGR